MKKSWPLILIMIFLSNVNVLAQKWDFTIAPYNSSDIGWFGQINVGLTNSKNVRFYSGFTVHYNHERMPDLDTSLYLHKRFRALTPRGLVGLNGGVQKNLNLFKTSFLTTFVSYDLTIRNMGAESYRAVPELLVYDSVSNQHYQFFKLETTTIKNLWSFENIFSVGVDVRMTERFHVVSTFGAGVNVVFNVPMPVSSNSIVAERSFKTSVGVRYRFY